MERKVFRFKFEDLKCIFNETVGDFTRIHIGKIEDVKVNLREEYENLKDIVIYSNNDCSISCGILLEQFNGNLQFTVTQFEDLVSLDKNIQELDVLQLNDNWGYEGFKDIAVIKDTDDIEGAKKALIEFLLKHGN